ncbi:MAG: ribosome assembly cofactor RimP [Eubacteriales bacterium]|nr:ribosome assembly cofactor RimP [Eubacteriales bacterium]
MEKYTKKVDAFLEPYLKKEGYVLIKTEFVEEDHNYYLRVYIDLTEETLNKRIADKKAEQEDSEVANTEEENQAGVGINDCVKVSRRLSQWLDKEDFIKEVYTLEVCSKGFLTPANDGEIED